MDRSSSASWITKCGAIMAAPEFFYQKNQKSSKLRSHGKKFRLSFTMYLW